MPSPSTGQPRDHTCLLALPSSSSLSRLGSPSTGQPCDHTC